MLHPIASYKTQNAPPDLRSVLSISSTPLLNLIEKSFKRMPNYWSNLSKAFVFLFLSPIRKLMTKPTPFKMSLFGSWKHFAFAFKRRRCFLESSWKLCLFSSNQEMPIKWMLVSSFSPPCQKDCKIKWERHSLTPSWIPSSLLVYKITELK